MNSNLPIINNKYIFASEKKIKKKIFFEGNKQTYNKTHNLRWSSVKPNSLCLPVWHRAICPYIVVDVVVLFTIVHASLHVFLL